MVALPSTALPEQSFLGAAGCLGALGAEVHPLSLVCPSVYTWVGGIDEGESNPSTTPGGF